MAKSGNQKRRIELRCKIDSKLEAILKWFGFWKK